MSTTSDRPDGYTTRMGAAAIGARLRRLSERIDRDAARLYAEAGVVFEQRWFGVVDQLARFGPLTVGELAAALGVSHAAVSQIRTALAAEGLISWEADKANARMRRLSLTEDGRARVDQLAPLWTALSRAAVDLNAEAQDAIAALDRLEQATARLSLYDRVVRLREGAED